MDALLSDRRSRWWLEWELALVLALVAAIHLSRIVDLPLRGEESRWARIATEMIASRDFVVPRQQGAPFLSRPPLQNWAIAAFGRLGGEVGSVATRLPSVLAVLATVALVYGYSRLFLSSGGAMAAAAAYGTFGHVLELGRVAETEALFTLFVSGSLLWWHWGYAAGWPRGWMWASAYLMVALGTLTKGMQAPVYFAVSVGTFLLVVRSWRMLVSRSHALGLLVFLMVWGAWNVPFARQLGWEGIEQIYTGDVSMHVHTAAWTVVVRHLARFPVEVILACLLPWSLLLAAYVSRDFRSQIAGARSYVLFLAITLTVTFPSCWLPPGARTRYFMPLYPCIAPLIGLVVERCFEAARNAQGRLAAGWRGAARYFLVSLACLMVLAGAGMLVAAALGIDHSARYRQPLWFALSYAAACGALAVAACWARRLASAVQVRVGVLAVAAFLGMTYSGVVTNAQIASSAPTARAVARLRNRLPTGTRLVSFEPIHHLFAFHFRDPVELRPWPKSSTEVEPVLEYFCFARAGQSAPALPFAWEQVAAISCDRNRRSVPNDVVIVGRRLPPLATRSEAAKVPKR